MQPSRDRSTSHNEKRWPNNREPIIFIRQFRLKMSMKAPNLTTKNYSLMLDGILLIFEERPRRSEFLP